MSFASLKSGGKAHMLLKKQWAASTIIRTAKEPYAMSDQMYIAASGALVQQVRLETLSNNLANSNTTGFKEDQTVFTAYLNEGFDEAGTPILSPGYSSGETPLPLTLPGDYYVVLEDIQTNHAPGQLKYSGNPLDVALQGSGFFCVETAEGRAYTRNGAFKLNEQGFLSTQNGLPVLGEQGTISVTPGTLEINQEGTVFVDGIAVDRLKVVDFPEPYPLQKVGDTMFVLSDPAVQEEKPELTEIAQGYTESSNVDPVRTMTEMIEVMRAYESYQKVIQSIDEINALAVEKVGEIV